MENYLEMKKYIANDKWVDNSESIIILFTSFPNNSFIFE